MGRKVVILSTVNYQSMIIRYLLYKNTHKNLDPCIDNKIQSSFLRFLRTHKVCFTEPDWKFLNDKQHEVSNFYGLPKSEKSMIIESGTNI